MPGLIELNGDYELVVLNESHDGSILYTIIHRVSGQMEKARVNCNIEELQRYFNNYVNQSIKPPGPAG